MAWVADGVQADGGVPMDAVLGVERSVSGRRWRSRLKDHADHRAAARISQQLDLPEVVGRVLAARGVTADNAEDFLNPSLRGMLPDPSRLAGMDAATGRLVRAVEAGEAIAVFGDYDVDGATSAAVLLRYLRQIGATARAYIPDRISEGYGPNTPALLKLRDEGVAVVITVDCGISAFEPLAAAAAAGLDVIVVDHHVAEPRLPEAAAVVNPNRLDDTSGCGQLAAVGVTFLLVVALNRALREAGRFAAGGEPDLMALLDLVALGTVCDMVPLAGVNRALVAQGLKVMTRRGNAGLAALADVAGIDRAPDAYHAGFVLGPRVNAGGRVGEAGLGARLLATDDAAEARRLAERLDGFNRERRRIEAEIVTQAVDRVERQGRQSDPLVFVAGEGWHEGVIGIVASRLGERYNRPACVVAIADGKGKGSGRSVPGLDLGAAVLAAVQAGLLIDGGGHPMAAGFTVAADRIEALRGFLTDRLAGGLGEDRPAGPELKFDGALQPAAVTTALVGDLARLGPFGAGNPQPRFALANVRLLRADVVGDGHLRCIVTGEGGGRLKAIAFKAMGGPIGQGLQHRSGAALHLAGHLRPDNWRGREGVQLIIDDAAAA